MDKKDKRTILVVGGDGMAGSMISLYLSEKGHDVHKTTRRDTEKNQYFLDIIENIGELDRIIEKVKPSFVINCIGVLNQSAEDHKSSAVLINSYLPHYIDDLSRKHSFKFVHISTDCVFSGDKGAYVETNLPDASSFYGQSKALGEVNNDKNLTFRTSIIGPDPNEKGMGLFNWFMRENGEVKGFEKVIWSGVTTLELAKVIEKSFEMDITGLYHLVNNDTINKYELLLLFKSSMQKDIVIKKENDYVSDKSLINTRKDFDFDIPSYATMVDEMSDWIDDHKDLYEILFVTK